MTGRGVSRSRFKAASLIFQRRPYAPRDHIRIVVYLRRTWSAQKSLRACGENPELSRKGFADDPRLMRRISGLTADGDSPSIPSRRWAGMALNVGDANQCRNRSGRRQLNHSNGNDAPPSRGPISKSILSVVPARVSPDAERIKASWRGLPIECSSLTAPDLSPSRGPIGELSVNAAPSGRRDPVQPSRPGSLNSGARIEGLSK
jgi:hypothetical protein